MMLFLFVFFFFFLEFLFFSDCVFGILAVGDILITQSYGTEVIIAIFISTFRMGKIFLFIFY